MGLSELRNQCLSRPCKPDKVKGPLKILFSELLPIMFLAICAVILLMTFPFLNSSGLVFPLFACQLLLLADQFRRPVGGVGGFVFMSVIFFGVRPVYLITESDYQLFTNLFMINSSLAVVNTSMWWGTLALLGFCAGAALSRSWNSPKMNTLRNNSQAQAPSQVATDRMAKLLLAYQIATLPIMLALAASGMSLYGSAMGAYVYDLPVPLQSGHIFAIMVILERYLRENSTGNLFLLVFSSMLFLFFTWLMRDVSMFRGFYIAGVMVAGIAVLTRLLSRVSLAWLILPIVLLQPLFRTLGEQRYTGNESLSSQGLVEQTFKNESLLNSYWSFYDSKGDINIFDTFAAAMESKPATRPYVLSWLYVPVHLVPRAVWKTKPEKGILQDVSFMNGAPYSPGIAGFLLLDGGALWMVASMLLLGYFLAWGDMRIYIMPPGHLRSCLIAILAVNAMFLTRFYLWQYFYQVLYAVIPCLVFAYIFKRRDLSKRQKRHSKQDRTNVTHITDPAH